MNPQTKKMYVSETVASLKPSGIRRFFDLASSLDGVISLGVGEPDFVTSWSIREASILSLEQGYTSYTANAGLLELRQEIAAYLRRKFHVEYRPETEILVTVGASQAIDLALRAIVNPGDEVIVVEPSFVAYEPLVVLAGGTPVIVHASGADGFQLMPAHIERAITERTKAVIICSPNNPTGTVLSPAELKRSPAWRRSMICWSLPTKFTPSSRMKVSIQAWLLFPACANGRF